MLKKHYKRMAEAGRLPDENDDPREKAMMDLIEIYERDRILSSKRRR